MTKEKGFQQANSHATPMFSSLHEIDYWTEDLLPQLNILPD